MKLRRPEALLLDAGNTLVFLDGEAVAEAASAGGVRLRPAAVEAAIGPATRRYESALAKGDSHEDGWNLFMRELLVESGAPRDDAPELVEVVRAAHDRFNLWRRVEPSTPAVLTRLTQAGLRLGVVSNSEGTIDALLDRVGLASFFETIVDSTVVGVRKPDPRIFRGALEAMGVEAKDATYVGDIPGVDVHGARAAGLEAVLIDAFGLFPDYAAAPRITSLEELARAWA